MTIRALLRPMALLASLGMTYGRGSESPTVILDVVSITSSHPGRPADHGFGLVIGFVDEVPLILTANHVLRGPEGRAVPESVTVRYVFDAGRAYRAEPTLLFDTKLDIAFLAAEAPELFHRQLRDTMPRGCRAQTKPGTPAFFVGRTAQWYVPETAGEIIGTDAEGRLLASTPGAKLGSSGAPLLNQDGVLLGVIIADRGEGRIVATPIESALRLLDGIEFDRKGRPIQQEVVITLHSCAICDKQRARPGGSTQVYEFCADYRGERCQAVRRLGLPDDLRTDRADVWLRPSCACLPRSWRQYQSRSDGSVSKRQLACTDERLSRELTSTSDSGRTYESSYVSFSDSALLERMISERDLRALVSDEDLPQELERYRALVEESRTPRAEAELPGSGSPAVRVHQPSCIYLPADAPDSVSSLRIAYRYRMPAGSSFCLVRVRTPWDRSDQIRMFMFLDQRWVFLPEL